MNIANHPDLVDRLAAAYALGTLRGGARRRFETLARRSPALRVAAQLWQERLMSITELQPGEAPSPNVWKRIENVVAATAPLPAAGAVADTLGAELLRRARNLWRASALAAVAAAAVAAVLLVTTRSELDAQQAQLAQARTQGITLARQNQELMAQLQAQPDIRYVAVLADDKSAPSMLVTFDPKHNRLTLKRVGGYQEAADKSLQLWALPQGGAPRSLGVLGTDAVARLAAAEQVVGQAPALAISLEPKGGVPGEGGPTGPVLFKGAVLQTPI